MLVQFIARTVHNLARRAIALSITVTIITGAGWSTSTSTALSSGTWSAPGGVASGLQLWLDVGEPATVFTATQARRWFDKSLAERDARSLDPSLAPILGSSSGYGELTFAAGYLNLASPIVPEPMTLVAVLRIGTTTSQSPIIGSKTKGTGITIATGKVRFYVNDVLLTSTLVSPSSGRLILLVRTTPGGTDYVSINGGSDLAVNFTSSEPLELLAGIYLGGVLRGLSGGVSEIAVWSRVLSSSERIAVTRALGARWGISVP